MLFINCVHFEIPSLPGCDFKLSNQDFSFRLLFQSRQLKVPIIFAPINNWLLYLPTYNNRWRSTYVLSNQTYLIRLPILNVHLSISVGSFSVARNWLDQARRPYPCIWQWRRRCSCSCRGVRRRRQSRWDPNDTFNSFILMPDQCDQIARLFFNIWPFTSIKICPKGFKICQSRFKILPNSE